MRETLERSGSSWHPSRREMLGALGVGLLAPRIARAATFALVDHCSTKIQNGIGGTNTINSTGADLLICAICTDQTSGAAFYSDSKGNTGWTLLFDQTCGWSGRIRLYYCIPTSVGSGHYLSISGSYVGSVFFSGFSGALQTPPADQQNGNGTVNPNVPTTLTTGLITPAYPNELVVTACVSPDGDSTGLSSGTLLDHLSNNVAYGGGFGYLIQTTATPVNLTWTQSVNSQMATAIASFKSASGVARPPVRRRVITGGE
jgi:hypothetical protein